MHLFLIYSTRDGGNYQNQGNICKLSKEVESLRQLERETLLFLRIFIEGYPLCHLCFREVLPLITDSVYFSHVWCSRLDSVLWATVPLSQSFLWTLQPFAINLCVVLGWPTQRARYFLDAVFHFPMASYCENAMAGSLCQHGFPFPSSPQPAHGRQTRTIPAWAAPFAQCCLWFGNFDYFPLHVDCLQDRMVGDNIIFAQSYCFSLCF